ncbi:hypothetical protein [Mesohalobacter halotolerans]|uniref:DUF4136 domain-containing protein n=1 Tax=Mesohalobacter halotolerans TaxID=1883405 RepID=A0A4U5TS69_9FLAO|nr:hypothetical protein [Mesohalobacter halotolerans]TKS56691.1 hypothetical protein FCN74_06580 [Mesohalobacter halotolerans]
MRLILPLLATIFCVIVSCGSQNSSSWKSPDYEKQNYRKVMVLAKTSDELAQRQLEEATVKLLKNKGVNAITAYNSIEPKDLKSENTFIKKANTLQVDALIVYNFGKVKSEYKRKPSIDANIGVPVKLGIFRGFLGTDIPLAGGNRRVETVNAQVSFYNRSSSSMQWSQSLSGDLKNGTQNLASSFASKSVNKMFEDLLF